MIEEELTCTVKTMAKEESPCLDGLIANFSKAYWSFMSTHFTILVNKTLNWGRSPNGVTRGLIALLFKEWDRLRLTNSRPITLLNIIYKIFAKTLLMRLQPVLVEVVNNNHTTFLPLRFLSLTTSSLHTSQFNGPRSRIKIHSSLNLILIWRMTKLVGGLCFKLWRS